MLAAILAGVSPAGGNYPVATVAITGDGAGDQTVESPVAKILDAWVRSRLQPLCVELGLPDFDVSVLIQAAKRIVTQRASSIVYDLGAFAGIYYASRHGLGLENWALFEFKEIINPLIPVQRVSKNDPSLKHALEILHLAVASS